LKLLSGRRIAIENPVFIHSSIKTRIETYKCRERLIIHSKFLYIVPLKQGLKQEGLYNPYSRPNRVFIHRSIKTRIETIFHLGEEMLFVGFYT